MTDLPFNRRKLLQLGGGIVCTAGISTGAAKSEHMTVDSTEVIFAENFESYSPGDVPPKFVLAGNEDQEVVDTTAVVGDQSYRMRGSHGGCWRAVMRTDLFSDRSRPKSLRFRGQFKRGNGVEGCHEDRSGWIGWRTVDDSSWSTGSGVSILQFRPDGHITAAGETIGTYEPHEWVEFDVDYHWDPSDGTVTQVCQINGQSPVTVTRAEHDDEAGLTTLALRSDDYTVYWDDLVVEQLDTDSPDQIETALDSYENAAVDLFNSEIEAQARLTAGIFNEHGQDFANKLVDYWGYKAGIIDEELVDEELRNATDPMLEELDNDEVLDQPPEEYASPLYYFFDELFSELDENDDYDTVQATTIDFFFGEHPNQTHELELDGDTVTEVKSDLYDGFENQRDQIQNLLDAHEPPAEVQANIVGGLENAAKQFRAEARDAIADAEKAVEELQGDPEEEIEYKLSMPEAEPPDLPELEAELDTDTIAEPNAALTGMSIAGTTIGGKYLFGGMLGLISLKGAVLMTLKLVALAVKFLIKKLILFLKKVAVKFKAKLKQHVIQNVERYARTIVERYLLIGTGILQAEITHLSTPDITEDDEVEKPLIPSFDNFWEDLISLLPFIGPSTVGRQTGKVTIKNTGTVSIAPEIDLTLSGYDSGLKQLLGSGQVYYGNTVSWLSPGEKQTYEFDYELPIDSFSKADADVEIYDFFLTKYVPLDDKQSSFDVGGDEGWFSGVLSDGLLAADEPLTEEYTVGMFTDTSSEVPVTTENDDPVRATINLNYSQSNIDLHVYDENNNHVGYDYAAEEVVVEIPNAEYSGHNTGTDGREWVHLEVLDSHYEIELVSSDNPSDSVHTNSGHFIDKDNIDIDRITANDEDIPYSLEVTEEPEQPAELGSLVSTAMLGGEKGETVSTTIMLEEIGGDNKLSQLSPLLTDLSHTEDDEQISTSHMTVTPDLLTIEGGEQEPVTATVNIPMDRKTGSYTGSLKINDSTGTTHKTIDIDLTVQATDEEAGIVTGEVTDTNGDPVGDITIDIITTDSGESVADTTTDSDGTYSVELSSHRTYEVKVKDEEFEPFATELTVEPDETHIVDIDLNSVSDNEDTSDDPKLDDDDEGDGFPMLGAGGALATLGGVAYLLKRRLAGQKTDDSSSDGAD